MDMIKFLGILFPSKYLVNPLKKIKFILVKNKKSTKYFKNKKLMKQYTKCDIPNFLGQPKAQAQLLVAYNVRAKLCGGTRSYTTVKYQNQNIFII